MRFFYIFALLLTFEDTHYAKDYHPAAIAKAGRR